MATLLDLGSASVEVTEFIGTDLAPVRDLVAGGAIVLLRDEITRPADVTLDQWPRDIAESVGECALVPLSCLTETVVRRYPLLVGQREAIRLLCSYADRLPPSPFPYSSRPVVTDYREFRHLWVADDRVPADVFMFQVGERMAQLHSLKILHGDAHIGNWGAIDGKVVVADPDPAFLHCLPSPEQCATDIRPLLPSLQSAGWLSFRLGYRKTWPEEGRVIDLIQLGDRTGWAAAFRARAYARCADLVGVELGRPARPTQRVMLLTNRALALGRVGRLQDAWSDCLAAARLAREHELSVATGLAFVQGMTLAAQGDRDDALDALGLLTADPAAMLDRFAPADARLPIMNM